jgi:hypothetical protein
MVVLSLFLIGGNMGSKLLEVRFVVAIFDVIIGSIVVELLVVVVELWELR